MNRKSTLHGVRKGHAILFPTMTDSGGGGEESVGISVVYCFFVYEYGTSVDTRAEKRVGLVLVPSLFTRTLKRRFHGVPMFVLPSFLVLSTTIECWILILLDSVGRTKITSRRNNDFPWKGISRVESK